MIIFNDFLEKINKGNIILVFTKNLITTSTAIHNVIPCIGVLNS